MSLVSSSSHPWWRGTFLPTEVTWQCPLASDGPLVGQVFVPKGIKTIPSHATPSHYSTEVVIFRPGQSCQPCTGASPGMVPASCPSASFSPWWWHTCFLVPLLLVKKKTQSPRKGLNYFDASLMKQSVACIHIYIQGVSQFFLSLQRTIANAPLPRLTISSPSPLLPHNFILQVSDLMAVIGVKSLNWPWPANIWFTVDDIVLEKQNFCPEARLHQMIYSTSPGSASGVFTNTVHYFNSSRSPIAFEALFQEWGRITIWINISKYRPPLYCHDFEGKFSGHFKLCLQVCLQSLCEFFKCFFLNTQIVPAFF